jgi:protein-S-isoprenylcysteine O-methyltransferase Ste14
MKTKILPPTYFMLFLFLSFGLHFIIPVLTIIHVPYSYLGFVFIISGIILNLWADKAFKNSKTTVKPYEQPSALETGGTFRISRHPMYLGMTFILLGEALLLGSLITFIFPVLFIILSEILYIPYEEKNLEQVFGEEYREYKKRVRRWI